MVKFGLVGIGGYGDAYVRAIREIEKEGFGTFGAAVIRTRGKYPDAEADMVKRGIPICVSLDEMLRLPKGAFDIAAIPTGIEVHRDQMIQAAEAGYNVVLEKPSTATVQDLDAMEAALRRTGKWCQIGFQSQSSSTVRELKREICAGRIGRVREVIVKGFWMRDNHYYTRNAWAGKLRNGPTYILDGTINNPMAHYLFNALYFASTELDRAAMPASVRAELYHAHDIESEDTSCLEVNCDNGARVFFYGTLAASSAPPIVIEIIGEKGRATWDLTPAAKIFVDGKEVWQSSTPIIDGRFELFRNAVRVYRGQEKTLYCPLSITRAHVLAVDGAFLSMGKTAAIPASALEITEQTTPKPHVRTVIKGIEDLVHRAAAERKLFSDLGAPWARKTKAVDVAGLKKFELPA
jgi:predicted dehydrogenase